MQSETADMVRSLAGEFAPRDLIASRLAGLSCELIGLASLVLAAGDDAAADVLLGLMSQVHDTLGALELLADPVKTE